MMLNKSIKLFIANFSLFWKILLYNVIVFGICALLMLPFYNVWGTCFNNSGFTESLIEFSTNTVFLNASDLIFNINTLVNSFVGALTLIVHQNVFAFIYTLIIICFVLPFLIGLCAVPAGESLYSYMSSLNKKGFVASFISNLKKSCVHSLWRTLILIPLMAIFLIVFYYLISLINYGGLMNVFLPFIIIMYVSVAFSLVLSTICGFLPATVAFDAKIVTCFKKGLKATSRRFGLIFSSIFVTMLITIFMVVAMTLVSVAIVGPLVYTWLIMFSMVLFFESQGMRYYVDLDTIITPRKLETCDSFKKVKDII